MPKATVIQREDGKRVTQEVDISSEQSSRLEEQYGQLPNLLTFKAVSKEAKDLGLKITPQRIAYEVSTKRITGISIKRGLRVIPEPAAKEYLEKAKRDDDFTKQEGVLKLRVFSEQISHPGCTRNQVSLAFSRWLKDREGGEPAAKKAGGMKHNAVEEARRIKDNWYISAKAQEELLDYLKKPTKTEGKKKERGREVVLLDHDDRGNTVEKKGRVLYEGEHPLPPPEQGEVRLCSIPQILALAAEKHSRHITHDGILEARRRGILPSYVVWLPDGTRVKASQEEAANRYLEEQFGHTPEAPVGGKPSTASETGKPQKHRVKVYFFRNGGYYEADGIIRGPLPPGGEKVRMFTPDLIAEEAKPEGISLTPEEIREAMDTGILPKIEVQIIHAGRTVAVPEHAVREYYKQLKQKPEEPDAAKPAATSPTTGEGTPYDPDPDLRRIIGYMPHWERETADIVLKMELERLARKHKVNPKALRSRLKKLME